MEGKEFFDQIKETLHTWQEPYENEAWEDFCRERNRRHDLIILWRYVGAAAVFLLVLNWILLVKEPGDKNTPHYVKHVPAGKMLYDHKTSIPDSVNQEMAGNSRNHKSVESYAKLRVLPVRKDPQSAKTNQLGHEIPKKFAVPVSPKDPLAINGGSQEGRNSADSNQFEKKQVSKLLLAETPAKKVPVNQHPLYDSLVKRPAEIVKKTQSNLLYAVALHPAIGNKKLSIGAGLEVAYPFNEHLSLGSGLSFASLHAEKTPDSESGVTQLQSSDLDVNGIELPLNLRYQVKGGFYVNAGISAVAVLSNQLSNNYLTPTTQTITQFNASGMPQQMLQVVNAKNTEHSAEQLAHYLGFYTFSIGKKQALGKNQFDLGPFIKIPFNPVSSQNIHLTQGGFRLSFGF